MKINWKVRLVNPVFWAQVAAAVVLPILAQLPMDPNLAAMFDAGRIEQVENNPLAGVAAHIDG